jgi:antitoxin (DNA-binding transcriptional repressor) of toxin-antitoxin stability system
MTTMTVRDIRRRWPEAEKAPATEKEIIITRDGVPVAKLSAVVPVKRTRTPFDLDAHQKWQESLFGKGVVVNWVEEFVQNDREERFPM